MNGGVPGKGKAICTAFNFEGPPKEFRSEVFGDHGKLDGSNNPQTFESTGPAQLDNIVFSNLIQLFLIRQERNSTCNDHVICDSGHNSDDEDQIPEDFPSRKRVRSIEIDQFELLYEKEKIEAQNNQKYTGNVCTPTTTDGWVGENNHQTGLSGDFPGGSNNPQTFESTGPVQLDNTVLSNLIQLFLISQEHNSTCNDHVICDSGHNSDDKDQIPEDFPSRKQVLSTEIDQFKPLYEKRKIEAQNNQKYTENVCNPTNGGLLGESDNPQTFESDPLKHGSNGLGYNFNGYSQATYSKLSASDQEEDPGYGSDSDGNSEDSSDSKKGSYYSSGNLDSMELTDGLDSKDDNPFLKDSLFMKLKISLTQSEQNLINKCCKKVRGITKQNKQECIEILESIKHTVAKYLEEEVMLNLQCTCCGKTVTNTVFEEIKDLTSGSHISNRSNTFVFDNSPCQSEDQSCNKEEDITKSIVSNLLLEGGKVKRPNFFDGNEFEQIVTYNGFDDGLSEEYKEIESKLKDLGYESIVNKRKQTQNILGLDKDNRYFCIEYSQDSIVEVAEILNNEKAKDLNLRVGILKIEESIVRVENVEGIKGIEGKRNYMDVSKGGIEMSFTTEVGEISIYLSPSEKGSNKIKVEIDGENRARLNELKNRGKSLGENCLLGGKSVEEAIEHESFKRYGSVPNTAMKEHSLGCVANIAKGG